MKISFLKIKKAFFKLATIFASHMRFFTKNGLYCLDMPLENMAFFRKANFVF